MLDQVRTRSPRPTPDPRPVRPDRHERGGGPSGMDGFREDLTRIENSVGLPIEVINSLRLLARARSNYLDAIVDYDKGAVPALRAPGTAPGRRPGPPGPVLGCGPPRTTEAEHSAPGCEHRVHRFAASPQRWPADSDADSGMASAPAVANRGAGPLPRHRLGPR